MKLQFKVAVMLLCGVLLSGCMVSKTKLDEAVAKCALIESDSRSKDQKLVKQEQVISALEAANKTLAADNEKTKQLSSEELAKARTTQEQSDAELLKAKGQLVEKEKELLAIKAEILAKSKELLTIKDEMARQLLEKDKESEDLIYKVREIQARTESLLEKIKTIQ